MSQFGVETQKISARSARSIVLYPILKIVALPIYKLCHRPPTRTRPDHSSSPPPPTFRTKSTPLLRWETNHWWNVLSASQGMSWLEFQCQEYLLSAPTPGIQCSGMVVELGSVANSCTNIITCGLWKHYFGVLGGTREPCPKATGQCSALLW